MCNISGNLGRNATFAPAQGKNKFYFMSLPLNKKLYFIDHVSTVAQMGQKEAFVFVSRPSFPARPIKGDE